MKVYLAGPMTGYPKFNYPAFDVAAKSLRGQGHEVESPAELDEPHVFEAVLASPDGDVAALKEATGEGFGDFLARDIRIVADVSVDGVVVLPGWEVSRGANLEVQVANGLGKPVLSYPSLQPAIGARHPGSERFHAILRSLGALHDRKQADYGKDNDPFANVRAATEWGVPEWVGALIRATDKVRRLQTYARRGTLANEGVLDAFDDLAVYAVIARVLFEEAQEPS